MDVFKIFTFESAHSLPNVSPEHKCARLHGHSFRVEIHVGGPVDPQAGWVMDFADIKRAFQPLYDELDHHYLNEVEGLKDKVKIVVNRVGLDNGQITLKKAEETIGREIFWQLPNDYRTMIDARNNGVPLIEQAPKAAITHSLIALAAALSGDPSPTADAAVKKTGVGRLFGFWPGKRP